MNYEQILKTYWGYDSFRGIQRQIIESICARRDTLGLMPTGGGKSVTFQVPALAMEGVCIVITPLISLMNDQVQHLRKRGIPAAAIHSGLSRREIITALENSILGSTKLLYVSPERIQSDIFKNKLKRIKVSFITVDEAHCISQWGYDFRPSYLHIADLRLLKPDAPILALTATATPEVVDDIQEQLSFREKNVVRMSFHRKNLAYVVRRAENKDSQTIHILNSVPGPAIVYVRSRKRTKEIAEMLKKSGISAEAYHAGLETSLKNERQEAWSADKTRVIVATTAFGMGIDKADVRLVIHYDVPSSPEEYFQEAGRAGRDGRKAYAVLLYNDLDKRKLSQRLTSSFPEKDFIRNVYEHLAYFYQIAAGSGAGCSYAFDIYAFTSTYHLPPIYTEAALKILTSCGYIDYEEDPNMRARLMFLLTRAELDMLNDLSPAEHKLVTVLLRTYGSLFVDYSFIDLDDIAHRAEMTTSQAYQLLRSLTMKRIAHFIPQRNTPIVTYLRDRVTEDEVVIPPSVYEQRRDSLKGRLKAMQEYCTNDSICRSRCLLAYFGETESSDCGICDICAEKGSHKNGKEKTADAREAIKKLLSDGRRHRLSEINELGFPEKHISEALSMLADNELIGSRGAEVWATE